MTIFARIENRRIADRNQDSCVPDLLQNPTAHFRNFEIKDSDLIMTPGPLREFVSTGTGSVTLALLVEAEIATVTILCKEPVNAWGERRSDTV